MTKQALTVRLGEAIEERIKALDEGLKAHGETLSGSDVLRRLILVGLSHEEARLKAAETPATTPAATAPAGTAATSPTTTTTPARKRGKQERKR
jgi:hypothetical protein